MAEVRALSRYIHYHKDIDQLATFDKYVFSYDDILIKTNTIGLKSDIKAIETQHMGISLE